MEFIPKSVSSQNWADKLPYRDCFEEKNLSTLIVISGLWPLGMGERRLGAGGGEALISVDLDGKHLSLLGPNVMGLESVSTHLCR